MSGDSAPFLRVVKGDPSPEEIAAVVAVLSARAAAVEGSERSTSAYADPVAGHRRPMRVGPGAWVASGWLPGTRTKAEL
jgi:hypothetical protein